MMSPRYQPASVIVREGLWILGGRDGNDILDHNEFLPYPAKDGGHRGDIDVKAWNFFHKKSTNEVWSELRLNSAMVYLPIPLSGHCALQIPRFTLIFGGLTTGHKTTDHVHVYDQRFHKWGTTAAAEVDNLAPSSPHIDRDNTVLTYFTKIKKMKYGRMNHACMMYEDNGAMKVIVAGGVSLDPDTETNTVLGSVEIMDWTTGEWIETAPLPALMTGAKFLDVEGIPVLAGRYGSEETNRLLRYDTTEKQWSEMPITLEKGRSDMQIIRVPATQTSKFSCP